MNNRTSFNSICNSRTSGTEHALTLPPFARGLGLPGLGYALRPLLGGVIGKKPRAQLIPTLATAPRLDGNPEELPAAVALASRSEPGRRGVPSFAARVAYRESTLFLGVEIEDAQVVPSDTLNVALFFPTAGTTAHPYQYQLGIAGKRAPDPETGVPTFANAMVQVVQKRSARGWRLEAAFPARALPRFPAKEPLLFELCLSYEDRAPPSALGSLISNCQSGSMVDQVLQLPDDFRKSLHLSVPPEVVTLEGRENGWVGHGRLHSLVWALSDGEMTFEMLKGLLGEETRDPIKEKIALSPRMRLRNVGLIYSLLTGSDPFAGNEHCDSKSEMRLGLYWVKANTARRVLDWPAATCLLGRALSVVMEPDGTLSISYTNGASVNFIWSTDHFERTEIG